MAGTVGFVMDNKQIKGSGNRHAQGSEILEGFSKLKRRGNKSRMLIFCLLLV